VTLAQLLIMAVCVAAGFAVVMAVAWRAQQTSGNSGWVDVSWTFGVGAIATLAALVSFGTTISAGWRQVLVAALCAAWSLRLGLHIMARTRNSGDDPRYRQLATEWGADAPRRMFWFLQSQAGVGSVLVLAVVLAAQNPNPALRVQDTAGLLVLAAALIGEAVADAQLRRFKASGAGRKAICDVGLWGWSRHPNYFFEWMAWLAYPVIAIDLAGHNPWGWLAVLAPACMYWVLVHVSGVPPLEAHMLRTRGDAFRAYQQRTRAFLPFPRMW
jgi:steroid 5-alpha reductase family enzyme